MPQNRDNSVVDRLIERVLGGVVRAAKFVLVLCLKIIGRGP
jgi:hypothetical protein